MEITKTYHKQDIDTVKVDELAAFMTMSRNKAIAIVFSARCSRARYRVLIDDLENQYSVKTNQYLVDLPSTLNAIDSYMQTTMTLPNRARHRCANDDKEQDIDTTFVQAEDPVPRTNGITYV